MGVAKVCLSNSISNVNWRLETEIVLIEEVPQRKNLNLNKKNNIKITSNDKAKI